MKVIFSLLVLLVCGCYGASRIGQRHVYEYEDKSTVGREVKAKLIRNQHGLCQYREVTLHHTAGMRNNWFLDNPSYVKGIDWDCDGIFDDFRFRSQADKYNADYVRLQDTLDHLYYGLVPIWNHPKLIDAREHNSL